MGRLGAKGEEEEKDEEHDDGEGGSDCTWGLFSSAPTAMRRSSWIIWDELTGRGGPEKWLTGFENNPHDDDSNKLIDVRAKKAEVDEEPAPLWRLSDPPMLLINSGFTTRKSVEKCM